MSLADILSQVSKICFGISGICLALALFFWFKFKIPSVISDLTGRTAKKSIEKLRKRNEQSGKKSFGPDPVNAQRGKLTAAMLDTAATEVGSETELLVESRRNAPATEQTELLGRDPNATDILVDDNFTGLLDETIPPAPMKKKGGKKLKLLEEVMLIHTDEVIV